MNKNDDIINNIITTPYNSLARLVLTLSRKCNYSCVFCPQSNVNTKYLEGFLDISTVEKLIQNLDNKFNGVFSLSGFGEPTLNPNFDIIINLLSTVPNTKIEVLSNGTNMNIIYRNIEKINNVYISAYSEKLYNNFQLNNKFKNIYILPRYKMENFNNRGGNSPLLNGIVPLNCCNLLFLKLAIDYNGDILKCDSDWNKDYILGNIYTHDIWDIWINSLKQDRLNLINNSRNLVSVCNKCTAKGNLFGDQYKDFWNKFYKKEINNE